MSELNKQISQNIPPSLTKRIDLNLGYSCNIKCRFCYYINDVMMRKKDKDLSTEQCKKLIEYYYRQGMRVLEFTGGEPTIRRDLLGLVGYARKTGFANISIITNGIRLADRYYAHDLVQAGVNDFLFSLHGSTADLHDFITCVPGSYKLLLAAVHNLMNKGARVRFNSVVTGTNLYDIYPRAKLFHSLGVKIINFIMFNPIEQAACSEESNFFRYSDAVLHLKRVIDEFGGFLNKLTIRYFPFCLMPGYERYIQNVHQVHYDHDEWNYYQRAYIREPYWKWLGGVLFGLLLLPQKNKWVIWGIEQAKHAAILEAHTWLHKRKVSACYKCSYRFICGGVWKGYASRFHDDGLKPKKGPFIIEPWYFMDDAQIAKTI
jgi:MoaA/NifB/PqqE/SkfB family radical SAM enzyme